jgi:hypothetical protein
MSPKISVYACILLKFLIQDFIRVYSLGISLPFADLSPDHGGWGKFREGIRTTENKQYPKS